jgi:hypothetical protein
MEQEETQVSSRYPPSYWAVLIETPDSGNRVGGFAFSGCEKSALAGRRGEVGRALLYRDKRKYHAAAGDYSFCRGYTEKPILKTGLETDPFGRVPP